MVKSLMTINDRRQSLQLKIQSTSFRLEEEWMSRSIKNAKRLRRTLTPRLRYPEETNYCFTRQPESAKTIGTTILKQKCRRKTLKGYSRRTLIKGGNKLKNFNTQKSVETELPPHPDLNLFRKRTPLFYGIKVKTFELRERWVIRAPPVTRTRNTRG